MQKLNQFEGTDALYLAEETIELGHLEGLSANNFRKISANGFGDPLNAYPHSMGWFKDRLYVATTRANLHLIWLTMGERRKNFDFWPVEKFESPYDLDLRAQIWRYDPRLNEWENVFISPMIKGSEGFEVPLSIGFRGMTIHQGLNDPTVALYIPTWPSRLGPGPILLRSFNGIDFEQISEPGLGDPTVTTIRSILSFKGKLFVAPTGTTKDRFSANVPDRTAVYMCKDPANSTWDLACEPFFGDRTNIGIFCMAVFNGYLYAGTVNAEEGFQIWKTDAEGFPPYQWKRVLSHGGFRGKENEGAVAMIEFKGKLYVGTGILGGYDQARNIGPAPPELFRLNRDDSWELIVGESRITSNGLKVPLSGLGAGFNSPTAAYFWRMCEHEGWLYLGTYDVTSWLPYTRRNNWSRRIRQLVEQFGIETILSTWAGFDLWRSRNGVRWFPVSRNGFGNPCNFGIRSMASSPFGLFIGAANPYGPRMAVRRLAGWKYVPNPRGGLEIWLGSKERNEVQGERCTGPPVSPTLMFGRATEKPNQFHEKLIADYYEESGFRHCGFWRHRTKSPVQACENLVEEILSFLPDGRKHILEIGCGRGATTRAILKHLPEVSLTGIVKKKDELNSCRKRVPELTCHRMRGPRLKFRRGSFDCVISVEGLKPFGNPSKLFMEIHRVLRPGGSLMFSDIILDLSRGPKRKASNIANSPEEFENLLVHTGFQQIQIHDTTAFCWKRFQKHVSREFQLKVLSKALSQDQYHQLLAHLPNGNVPVSHYIICSALKKGGAAENHK